MDEVRGALGLGPDWTRCWTATWRYAGNEVNCPVRDLGSVPAAGCEPVRRFSWRRDQRHRSGLQFLVSTGRHHGFESLEEARLLLALDFAADLVNVLAQPLRLRYSTRSGPREHIPDFLAFSRTGRWLIDVRPAARVTQQDRVAFAASAEVALLLGWRYVVVTGWKPHVTSTLDTLSAQRRPLTDRLGMADALVAAVAAGPRPFGELAGSTVAPPVARAWLLHLLWQRRLGVELGSALSETSLVCAGKEYR
ncbi:TnsA-like heteromeric transposase endonuclease subunit [Phytohabitans aurantiacus]|uniref:TnsA-like heteromeric transposase endonuclease subunit n=1 Tax=Phytohabitans aurantiacus TaxID=3016789 RepID=UPI0024933F20|nr:TnsA-like heteromeric transposase endonuclease subunit [Phytohabitans aurantiacus]